MRKKHYTPVRWADPSVLSCVKQMTECTQLCGPVESYTHWRSIFPLGLLYLPTKMRWVNLIFSHGLSRPTLRPRLTSVSKTYSLKMMDELPDTQSFSIFFSNWTFPKSKARSGYTFCFVQLSRKEKKKKTLWSIWIQICLFLVQNHLTSKEDHWCHIWWCPFRFVCFFFFEFWL